MRNDDILQTSRTHHMYGSYSLFVSAEIRCDSKSDFMASFFVGRWLANLSTGHGLLINYETRGDRFSIPIFILQPNASQPIWQRHSVNWDANYQRKPQSLHLYTDARQPHIMYYSNLAIGYTVLRQPMKLSPSCSWAISNLSKLVIQQKKWTIKQLTGKYVYAI